MPNTELPIDLENQVVLMKKYVNPPKQKRSFPLEGFLNLFFVFFSEGRRRHLRFCEKLPVEPGDVPKTGFQANFHNTFFCCQKQLLCPEEEAIGDIVLGAKTDDIVENSPEIGNAHATGGGKHFHGRYHSVVHTFRNKIKSRRQRKDMSVPFNFQFRQRQRKARKANEQLIYIGSAKLHVMGNLPVVFHNLVKEIFYQFCDLRIFFV